MAIDIERLSYGTPPNPNLVDENGGEMMNEGIIDRIERIEKLVDKGQVSSVPLLDHVFRLWLKNFFDGNKIKVEEDVKSGVKPSITVIKNGDSVFLAWQNVDPETDLLVNDERNKIKAIALYVYSKVLLPKFLFLSNGRSLFVYNSDLKELLRIPHLKDIDEKKRKKIYTLLKQNNA